MIIGTMDYQNKNKENTQKPTNPKNGDSYIKDGILYKFSNGRFIKIKNNIR